MAAMHLTTFYQNSLYLHFVVYLAQYIFVRSLPGSDACCNMHLHFYLGTSCFVGGFSLGTSQGWGLLRLTFYSTSTQQYALSSYRAARDTSHRFYYSLSYSSQASSRMQERARMLLICAVVALYSGFASCRPEDYPFRNWTLPWEERVMVS